MNTGKIRNSVSSSYHTYLKRGISGITSSSRVLPNFIIIGTVRSGTTSLYYNICEHPSVLPADYDEIGFFDSNFQLGINWYRSMFPTKADMKKIRRETQYAITGEDTPFYFWKDEVVERISQTLPNVKLILILRNPVDRAYSNYKLAVRTGNEKFSFDDAIDTEMRFMKDHTIRESIDQRRSYLAKGLYSKQLKLWRNNYSEKDIHILCTEDMRDKPKEELSKIFKFLEISEYDIKNPQQQKMYKYEDMNPDIRQKLIEYYRPHNRELFDLMGRKFDWDD